MNRKWLIALTVVAAALGAFIFFVDRGSLSSGELEERRGRLLEHFVRPRVMRVEIQRRGAKTVLVRERSEEDPEDELEVGVWKLDAPVRADTDEEAVDALLSAMEWAEARRTIRGIDEDDRQRFGLTRPRIRAWFTAGTDRIPIVIGNEAPTDDGVYVQLGEPDVAYVAGKDFFEAFDHETTHFRSKRLFSGFDVTRATEVTLRGEGAERRLELDGERWFLRAPVDALASRSTVEDVLRAIDEARAARFVAESARDLARYGLDRPWRELVAVRPAGAADEGHDAGPRSDARPQRARLRIGRACADHPDERFAIADDAGPIVCVATASIEQLGKTADELRERRLILAPDESIQKLVIEVGSRRLEVEREDEKWTYRAQPSGQGDANDDAIAQWLRALREIEARGFERASASAVSARGLQTPAATLTIDVEGEDDEVVKLGTGTGETVWARRGDEAWLLEVPGAARELVDPSPVRLRDRRVLDVPDRDVVGLVIQRGAETEELALEEGAWKIRRPRAGDADRTGARELVHRMAELDALRFVAERAEAAHGLSAPRYTVTLRVRDGEATREHRLKIGAATDGGAFAQLDPDAAVFVVGPELVDLVDGPMISRNLLQTDAGELATITLERGATRIELRRDGEAWNTAAGATADAERTQRLIDRLAALRASDVEPAATTAPADVRVTITRTPAAAEPRRYTFDITTSTTGEADAQRVRIRSPLVTGTYLFPPDVVATFRDYTP